ncbi:hypothetical protein RHECNPAF_1260027 [Rhizobium etli CNPAF512]|nr:hypothetical protein RHECNPAF_1260027 [Rhizobium etli CNPAF512]
MFAKRCNAFVRRIQPVRSAKVPSASVPRISEQKPILSGFRGEILHNPDIARSRDHGKTLRQSRWKRHDRRERPGIAGHLHRQLQGGNGPFLRGRYPPDGAARLAATERIQPGRRAGQPKRRAHSRLSRRCQPPRWRRPRSCRRDFDRIDGARRQLHQRGRSDGQISGVRRH